MKTFIKSLVLVAVAATMLVSCKKDKEAPAPIDQTPAGVTAFKFYANTDGVATKATLTPNEDETSFAAAWENGDSMVINTVGSGAEPNIFNEDGIATWDGSVFNAAYNEGVTLPATEYNWAYKAWYPGKANVPFGDRKQNGNLYNSAYDLMYGTLSVDNAVIGKNADNSPIVIQMNRLTGIAYYHITGDLDEDVVSATLTVGTNAVIAAETIAISDDGQTITPENGTNKVTITFEEGTAPKASDLQLWFNVLPGSYDVTVDIVTTGHTAKLTSKSARTFTAGKLNRAKISNLTWTEKPTIIKGLEYTLATSSDLQWSDMSTALVHNSMSWVPAVVEGKSGASVQSYDASRGAHFGSANTGVTEMTFTGTGYSTYCQSATACGISAITVNVGAKNGETVTGVVTVGGTPMSAASEGSNSYLASNNTAGAISFSSADLLTGDIVIELTLSHSGALYVKDIIINPDSRINPELAYSPSSYTVIANGSLDTPTLSYVSGFEGTVTYAIGENDNPNVANVDATTGAVTIGSELGSVTVTASFAGNETYKSAQASYTITVIEDPNQLESKTIAEFIEAADTETNYRLTGTVTSEINTTYKRFILTDATGSLTVFGLDDVTAFVEGDIVTLYGKYQLYGQTHEVVDGVYESHISTPKMDVSTTSIIASDAETSSTFNIVADASVAWTVVSDNSAVAVSPTSGTGNETITVSFDENTATSDKTATITVLSSTENVYKNREVDFTQTGRVGGKPITFSVPSNQSFTYSSNMLSTTYNNVTITQAAPAGTPVNSNNNTTSTLRVYQNNTLTFESDYYITGIQFTHSGNYSGAAISPDSGVYNGTTEAWTGQAKKVILTMGSQLRPSSIMITYLDPNATVENPTLTVDDDFELVVGQTKTLTVSTNSDGVISYQSSNTAIATVVDGVVTAVAPGEATITVNVAAADWYYAASETVVATVVAKSVTSLNIADLKTSYATGEDFDASCTVTAYFNNGTSEVLDTTDYDITVTKDNAVVTALTNLSAGTYYATITYDGFNSDPIEIIVSDGGGEPVYGTITITRSSFPSGSLAYNVTDAWTAIATTGETITGEGDLYSTANQTTMQSKNSGVSTMYHNTVSTPGPITKITLNCASGSTRTYTAYMNKSSVITSTSGGTSKGTIAPAAGNSASLTLDAEDGWHYFWLNLAGGASYLDSIIIEYLKN